MAEQYSISQPIIPATPPPENPNDVLIVFGILIAIIVVGVLILFLSIWLVKKILKSIKERKSMKKSSKIILIIIGIVVGIILIIFTSIYLYRWYHTRISSNTPQNCRDECPSDKLIKGNSQSGIYHMPSGRYYKRTCAEQCFATEDEAKKAGFRKSKY